MPASALDTGEIVRLPSFIILGPPAPVVHENQMNERPKTGHLLVRERSARLRTDTVRVLFPRDLRFRSGFRVAEDGYFTPLGGVQFRIQGSPFKARFQGCDAECVVSTSN